VTELPFVRDRPDRAVATPLSLDQLRAFDAIIDARSPSEYGEDHLPDAMNAPVLDDAERAQVGTIYKQESAFEAKRVGAPIVARNIARHIEERFAAMPKDWRPLVYCWRGGGRSGSLVHVLRQVGWDAVRLDGGYKAFRKQVVADLESMPERFSFEVVCGATGSGKSRLLEALDAEGAQVLDLEKLAAHRGAESRNGTRCTTARRTCSSASMWPASSTLTPRKFLATLAIRSCTSLASLMFRTWFTRRLIRRSSPSLAITLITA